jgi:triacylglycerol lipase
LNQLFYFITKNMPSEFNRSQINPVLLLHGITDTSQKMRWIARHLKQLDWEVYALDLVPNNGDAKLEVLAQQMADFVKNNMPANQPIDIVGFSMGGLVSRYYIQRLGGIDRVARFITISAPHRGTLSAYLSQRPGCVQMRPDHQFIIDLNRDVEMLNRLKFTSLWTPFDLIILPPQSSQLPIGTDLKIPAIGHALMVSDRRSIHAIVSALSAP